MIGRLFLCLMLSLQLIACSGVGVNAEQKDFKAQYIWGEGVNAVHICNEDKEYWVRAQPKTLGELERGYLRLTSTPYEYVYITFKGELLNEKLDGFAENYDGYMRVSELLTIAATVPKNCLMKSVKK